MALLLTGMLYTQDTVSGWKVIETHFAFLALPFVFGKIFPVDGAEEKKILRALLIGIAAGSLLYSGKGAYDCIQLGYFSENVFYESASLLDFAPTYVACFMVTGLTIALYQLSAEKRFIPPILALALIIILFPWLLVTMNQSAFIAFLFILSFFLFQFVAEASKRKRNAMLAAAVLLVSMFGARHYMELRPDLYVTDSGERFALWNAAVLANTDVFAGVGTGDYTQVLTDYYKTIHEQKFAAKEYNAHNQYINTWLGIGLAGLLTFLTMLILPLYFSAKCQYKLGVLLLFPFAVYACSEVFLGRYQGLVMWTFLNQLVMNKSLFELGQKSIRVNSAWVRYEGQNKV
ncbi:MAG: hypothetical protein CRN43_08455 [Candidatus Nephrothrix sp. EaCA]|nr:MAG: hypothetical protein CRN43_08455 [Candidatus Nephrothrix sp. EaCA]